MRATLTAIVAAIEAGAVALAGIAAIAIPAVLLWILTFDLSAEPEQVVAGVAMGWLLAHFVPLTASVNAEIALGLGLEPEGFTFTVSLVPLGLTLITVLLAARAGWRFGQRGGTGAAGVLGGMLSFGVIVLCVVPFAGPLVQWPLWAVVLVPSLVYGLPSATAFLIRAALDEHGWWTAIMHGLQRGIVRAHLPGAAALRTRAAEACRIGVAALAGIASLGALGVAVALAFGYVHITALTQSLQLDPLGAIVVFLLHLALLPVALIWALAWFSGAGFAVGAGSSVSPFGTLLGPLPSLPLFGAIPQGWGGAGALAPMLIVLLGIGIGLAAARRVELRRGSMLVAMVVPIISAVLVGCVVSGLSTLATGSIGPDRLAENGPDPWAVGGLVAAEVGIGMLLGVLAGRIDLKRVREALPASIPLPGRDRATDESEPLEAYARGHEPEFERDPRLAGERRDEGEGGQDFEPTQDLTDDAADIETEAPGLPVQRRTDRPVELFDRLFDRAAEPAAAPLTAERSETEGVPTAAGDPHGSSEPGDAGEPRDSGGLGELDELSDEEADALLRAYSWEQAPEPAEPEKKRRGWRWPGSKR